MSWIKDNGGILTVGGVLIAAVLLFMEFRTPALIRQEMANQGLYTAAEATNLNTKLENVENLVSIQQQTHNDDRDRMDSKIERVVDILLEE